MIVNRKAVIVSVLGASLAAGSAARAGDSNKKALNFESTRETLTGVLGAIADGNLGKASAGLGGFWGEGRLKGGIKKVNLDDKWGGPTGRPPETPGWKLQPREPQRPEPRQEPQRPEPRQEPQRQEPPQRQIPPELRLPPTVIPVTPGTIRPA